MKPQTKYTKSGRVNIAYQVIEGGPMDIVYIPGWVSNIDLMWECPQLVSFLEGLNKFARVILFDKRGTGLSDRMIELSSLEERMDDIRAVMDAVGSQRAILFGHSEGGSVSALFAATYPERVMSLITFGVFAKRRHSDNYPWAPTDAARAEVYQMIMERWGSGDMDLASLAPSMAEDQQFMDWLARYFRSGASPSAALALTKMNTEVDIIDILDTIVVPTLLMCRTNDIDVKVEESQFMAEKIRGAKFVEFDGDDHLFWAGNVIEVLEEITEFVTGRKPVEQIDRRLATIVSVQFIDTDLLLDQLGFHAWQSLKKDYTQLIEKTVYQYRGTLNKLTDKGLLAVFDGPSKAAHCALALQENLLRLEIGMSIGVHTGECIYEANDELSGLASHIARQVNRIATKDQIVITQTVKNLLSGAGLEFKNLGSHKLLGIDTKIDLLALQEEVVFNEPILDNVNATADILQNHSFLENVLQSIETNISDENYDINTLCRDIGFSERQLQRKLKLIANKSPSQMVRSVRLHKAKELLTSSGEGVSQVAYQTGFNSLSYFTKCFKKEFGMAPNEMAQRA